MITESILGAVVEAIAGYILELTSPGEWIRDRLGLSPNQQALKRALRQALEEFEAQQPAAVANLLDGSFLQHEGASILAQFFVRNGRPDPSELAAAWADSLTLHSPQRTYRSRQLEPAAADLLEMVANALKAQPELQELNDGRALEQLADNISAIRTRLGARQATIGTRRDYLDWLIDRNKYLDSRGILQTQRQVQVRLNDIYISLRARLGIQPTIVDRQLMDSELDELEERRKDLAVLQGDHEDQNEFLAALVEWRAYSQQLAVPSGGETAELDEVVRRYSHLALLGDPGSGKTTLLRYLALRHAEALFSGRTEVDANLGIARFPIIVRIAEYADDSYWRRQSLSEYLPLNCSLHECPSDGLTDLFASELKSGNCVVLLDGLDEVVDADDRRGIVERIEDFVRRHQSYGNRFVITSRVAGYRSAPLTGPFVHFIIQEMDDSQIRAFLESWCPAVETAQTPDLSPESRMSTAQRELNGILSAIQTTPGVRRLASNPLLLRTLALIHRAGARLPQRRIELYKLAADTLVRIWRQAHRVPDSALVDDRYVTQLLGTMAYWLRTHKPTGLASEKEVYAVLGEEWARLRRLSWDPEVPDPRIETEVGAFLQAVREHTGLFVERAPRRYGFMHATFEEYYAARHLIAHHRSRAVLIRRHLHDPRWEECILLGLGFVGLDYPEEAADLVQTAVLAEGEEASRLQLSPSPYETLLGRDYLFALHCLGDRIPVDIATMQHLISKCAEDLLRLTPRSHFERYRYALQERLHSLSESEAGSLLETLLISRAGDDDPDIRCLVLRSLGHLMSPSPSTEALMLQALNDQSWDIKFAAIESLIRLRKASPEVVDRLQAGLAVRDRKIRSRAVEYLGQIIPEREDIIPMLLMALQDSQSVVRFRAALALGRVNNASSSVVNALFQLLTDPKPRRSGVRDAAAWSLAQLGQTEQLVAGIANSSPKVRTRVLYGLGRLDQLGQETLDVVASATNDQDWHVRTAAVWALGQWELPSVAALEALLLALADSDWHVRAGAAASLGRLREPQTGVVDAIVSALTDVDWHVRDIAIWSLIQLRDFRPVVVDSLIRRLHDGDRHVRTRAAWNLSHLGEQSFHLVDVLSEVLDDPEAVVRMTAASGLIQLGHESEYIVNTLVEGFLTVKSWQELRDTARRLGQVATPEESILLALVHGFEFGRSSVRAACARALSTLGWRFPTAKSKIAECLMKAISAPELQATDKDEKRPGYEYAYDALWMMLVGDDRET